jgi:hypothetical protein
MVIKSLIILSLVGSFFCGCNNVKISYEKIRDIIFNPPGRAVTGRKALRGQCISSASVMIFFIATFVLSPYYQREKHYDLITPFCRRPFNKFK